VVAEAGLELERSFLEGTFHNLAVVHTERFAAGHIRVGRGHTAEVGKVRHLPRARSTTCYGILFLKSSPEM
jgi:hypothetical protein